MVFKVKQKDFLVLHNVMWPHLHCLSKKSGDNTYFTHALQGKDRKIKLT